MSWMQRLASWLGLEQKQKRSSPPVFASQWEDGRAHTSDWSTERAITEGMKANPWVYAAISKVAAGMASVPLVLERRNGEHWVLQHGHELQKLLDRPNPHMGRQDVQRRWAQHMMLSGNAVWWLNIVQNRPVEMWPLQPDTVKPIASRTEFISGYEWRVDAANTRRLDTSEIAHWMFPDPSNPRWGLAPLMAGAAAVDMDQAAARWNRAVLLNDGKPPVAVMLNEGLTIQQAREASGFIREQMSGGNIRQALVLGGTSRLQTLSLNATDLDFLNGRKFSREEIAAVFGVPPILLSFGDGATYANLDAAKTALWEDRIVPLLDDFCGGLMGALFPFWGLDESQYRIRADLSGVRALQGNLKTEAEVLKLKTEAYATLVSAGVDTREAARLLPVQIKEMHE